jgi:hypothetical protein
MGRKNKEKFEKAMTEHQIFPHGLGGPIALALIAIITILYMIRENIVTDQTEKERLGIALGARYYSKLGNIRNPLGEYVTTAEDLFKFHSTGSVNLMTEEGLRVKTFCSDPKFKTDKRRIGCGDRESGSGRGRRGDLESKNGIVDVIFASIKWDEDFVNYEIPFSAALAGSDDKGYWNASKEDLEKYKL